MKTAVKEVKTTVKGVKKATKETVKVYQSLEKMEPLKITKDMSDKEKCLRAGYNLGLITAQKSKGRFDATVDVWKGIYGELIEFVANSPRYIIESAKETGKGIGNLVLHPVQTTTAIKDSIIDSYEKDVINGNAYSKSYWETKTKLNAIKEFCGRKGTGLLNDIPNSKNGIISDSRQPSLRDVTFKEGYDTHLIEVEGIVRKKNKGVVGGHNLEEFEKAFIEQGWDLQDCIISKKQHPRIEGIYEIEYGLPALDRELNIIPGELKKVSTPTVYDPRIISNEQMLKWGEEAMKNGEVVGRKITGTSQNGLKFQGYIDEATGEVTNFFPILND